MSSMEMIFVSRARHNRRRSEKLFKSQSIDKFASLCQRQQLEWNEISNDIDTIKLRKHS